MPFRSGFPILMFVLATECFAQAKAELPRVVLVGDSIRLGYAPIVAQKLEGKATVISAEQNGGDSSNVLAHLEEWVLRERPDIVHFNAGLHDLKVSKQTRKYQIDIPQYEKNLRQIIARIRNGSSASLIFASTTPILDSRHSERKADFDRVETDVQRYNESAFSVMADEKVLVNDLHWLVLQNSPEKILQADGTYYTAAGYEKLADAVVDCLLRELTIRRYRPLPQPPSGPNASAAYLKDQAERDAKVPSAYRNLSVGQFPLPKDRGSWTDQRSKVRKIVIESLGDLPKRPAPPRARIIARELRQGYVLERVSLENGFDSEVSALLLIPNNLSRPAPAILWLHSSTPDKTQIIIPNTNGGEEALGEAFVRAGYAVLAPDAYWHGDRVGTGPAGTLETGREEQESLPKLNLWLGRTLWGMFVHDDQVALDYLVSRKEVDPARIGTTGMSMGSTRAWWLAAVDERIRAVVGVACLTRYQNLIAHGQLRQHGVYYFVHGLLPHFDTEAVLALIAPRPFLALTGELDPGSPADGIRILEDRVGRVYGVLGAGERMRSILYPGIGHAYTPEMRREMLEWFERWLR